MSVSKHMVVSELLSELGIMGDPKIVQARARELGVEALICASAPAMPKDASMRARALSLLIQRETAQVRSVLADVPHAVLKGPDLAKRIFGSPSLRSSGDVDVLVERRDLSHALSALSAAGWVQNAEVALETNNQVQLARPGLQITTEVHWAVALPHIPQPPPAYFMGDPMRPEPLLIYLAYHFHNHVGFLKGLLDIAAWIDSFAEDADWWEIDHISRSYGVSNMIAWPLRSLELLTGSHLHLPSRSPVVEAWARHTADVSRGILAATDPITHSHSLGLKTWDTRQSRRVGANWASLSLIDHPTLASRSLAKAVFLGPEIIRRRFPDASEFEVWMRVIARPLSLIRKATR